MRALGRALLSLLALLVLAVDVPEVRAHIDELMREKYGLTDLLIRWLEGSPESVPVRLDPS